MREKRHGDNTLIIPSGLLGTKADSASRKTLSREGPEETEPEKSFARIISEKSHQAVSLGGSGGVSPASSGRCGSLYFLDNLLSMDFCEGLNGLSFRWT